MGSQPTSPSPANCGSLRSNPLLTFPPWANEQALCLLSESAGRRHFKPHHSKTNMLKPAEMQRVNNRTPALALMAAKQRCVTLHWRLPFGRSRPRLQQPSGFHGFLTFGGETVGKALTGDEGEKRKVRREDDHQQKNLRGTQHTRGLTLSSLFCSTGCRVDTTNHIVSGLKEG